MENYVFFDNYLNGRCPDAYQYFGAHKATQEGKAGYLFRVYAPMANEVDVIGDFNNWDPLGGRMGKLDYRGLFETFIPGAQEGQRYKFHIFGCDGFWKDKQDPFAFKDEVRDLGCSILADISKISIADADFVAKRDRCFNKPVSIYEFHFGTWKRREDGSEYTYSQLADIMIPYLRDMGYTHVEALPITAYPNDKSWGYQALGYYAVDSRWGSLSDFASFIEKMHQAGIGVIMDFVPVHFAVDSFGLEKFDGSCVYEYANEHEFTEWGTKAFDLGKDPVRSFLMSSVLYFAKVFHLDGFRFDAVSNVIYWDGNSQKGENAGGIEFIKRVNAYVHDLCPNVMMMAEDSSAYGHVTKGLFQDGLGFDYKWDLGWMNDTLKYYAKDPIYKKYCHNQLTFSMAYFYSENFILPLSHDEVVHMKGSIVNKMWGNYDNKFANVRNLYAYQFAHPGKKLNFMGNEIAAFDEWKEWQPLAFNALDYPKHQGVQRLIRDLNQIYKTHSAMYNEEYNPTHFSWIMADNSDQSVYVFYRESQEECLVFLFNMTPNFYWDYDVGVPYEGTYEEILNTDKAVYGGWNQFNPNPISTNGAGIHNQKFKITLKLPSFGAVYLCYRKPKPNDDNRPYVSKDPNLFFNKGMKV
ncbi:MAG: 1,4-alpha-glucan branching protein GlgB [Bacilli bacterium]|jgi:1,4-alpha-glucan branching enzyme|nr:1,4-alpha-glucan branching protein GlgB [Bacilli bacterium]